MDLVKIVRQRIAEEFGVNHSNNVIFTFSATAGMNTVLKSLLNKNDHVVTTNAEHHCVYRTLEHLREEKGITYDVAEFIDEMRK